MGTVPPRSARPLPVLAAALAPAAVGTLTVGAGPAHSAACAGYVGLTFDDGPSAAHTPGPLSALRANGLRATLFNEGQYAAAYPAQVRAEVNAGMWVGNHSCTHPHLTRQSQAQTDSEISRTRTAVAAAGGGTPVLFRPPYGETDATVRTVEAKYGLTEIIWDVDSQDWNGPHARMAGQHAQRDPAHRTDPGGQGSVLRTHLPADRPRGRSLRTAARVARDRKSVV